MKPRLPRWAILLILFLGFDWPGAAASADIDEIVLESVSREHCSTLSGQTVEAPRRVVLVQMIVRDDQLDFPFGIYATSEYIGQQGVKRGKIVVWSELIKSDGTVIPLPTLSARVKNSRAYAFTGIGEAFEAGDVIRWVGSVRRHPPIDSCWRLEMGIETGGKNFP